ncbi:MAG: GNAT family acetyltransferase [Bacilli bacterium]|nr:GNAT family acetyltransferase [Bacilli bacterium]
MAEYIRVNILDLIENFGEDKVKKAVSSFACEKNADVELFLKTNAIEFAKKKTSITYLVIRKEPVALVGYFTLMHKSIVVKPGPHLSSMLIRAIEKCAKLDETNRVYNVSAFLIAQFAKNSNIKDLEAHFGDKLMGYALNTLIEIRRNIGGRVVFLECEKNKTKLVNFYQKENNFFRIFGSRIDESGKTYLQLLRHF